MGSSSKAEIEDRSRAILKSLEAALADLRDHAAADPFSNSIVLFAIDLARLSIARALAELECGSTPSRALLDEAGRAERMAAVYSERHRPLSGAKAKSRRVLKQRYPGQRRSQLPVHINLSCSRLNGKEKTCAG